MALDVRRRVEDVSGAGSARRWQLRHRLGEAQGDGGEARRAAAGAGYQPRGRLRERLMLFSGARIRQLGQIGTRLDVFWSVYLKTFSTGRSGLPLRGVHPRRRRLHRPADLREPAHRHHRERRPHGAVGDDRRGGRRVGSDRVIAATPCTGTRARTRSPRPRADQVRLWRGMLSRQGSIACRRWTSTPARSRASLEAGRSDDGADLPDPVLRRSRPRRSRWWWRRRRSREAAKKFSEKIAQKPAILNKERPAQQVAEIGYVIGEVKGKTAVIVDDMIETAGDPRGRGAACSRRARCACSPICRPTPCFGQRLRELLASSGFEADRRDRHDPSRWRAGQRARALLRRPPNHLDRRDLHGRVGVEVSAERTSSLGVVRCAPFRAAGGSEAAGVSCACCGARVSARRRWWRRRSVCHDRLRGWPDRRKAEDRAGVVAVDVAAHASGVGAHLLVRCRSWRRIRPSRSSAGAALAVAMVKVSDSTLLLRRMSCG